MKPPPFRYHDPRTVQEALSLLKTHGDGAKILAGGQSLVPMLNLRLARPSVLVDINRVAGLAYVRRENGELAIGALARQADVEASDLAARAQPLLVEALGFVGHLQIRNRGTVAGSLAHADPAAELGAVWTCLDGRFRIAGAGGVREVGPDEFFVSYFTTAIQPDELLVEVRLPALAPRSGTAFVEAARRHGDFALVAVACCIRLEPGGAIAEARLGLAGVGPVPVRAREAEALLRGARPAADLLAEAGRRVQAALEPDSDVHATADYRRHLAGVLVRRALTLALERARGGAA